MKAEKALKLLAKVQIIFLILVPVSFVSLIVSLIIDLDIHRIISLGMLAFSVITFGLSVKFVKAQKQIIEKYCSKCDTKNMELVNSTNRHVGTIERQTVTRPAYICEKIIVKRQYICSACGYNEEISDMYIGGEAE